MRFYLSLILLIFVNTAFSQSTIQGVVRDAATNEVLPFCNIAVKGSVLGTITNKDGRFQISVSLSKDTLMFSYLGYEALSLPVSELSQQKTVLMIPKGVALNELEVHANPDYIYEIIEDCRKKLRSDQGMTESKMYFGLETYISGKAAELLECYYNANLEGISLKELRLKNGRMGLGVVGSRIFNNWETSLVVSKLDLLNKNYYYPSIPLQYGRKEMKTVFNVSMESSDSSMYHIAFVPRTNRSDHFAGELWIDKQSMLLLKIRLQIQDAAVHPFISVLEDSISHVSFDIVQTFRKEGTSLVPSYIAFDYSLYYATGSGNAREISIVLPDMNRKINTQCVLYFYDYNRPFILPYFDYNSDVGEYEMLSIVPYNRVFWENNQAMLLTEQQKEDVGFFAEKGSLLNFSEGNYGKDFCAPVNSEGHRYFLPYTFWSPDKRIFIARGLPQTEVYSQDKINQCVQRDLYDLKVQLLLDVNQKGDSLDCRSYTVFDEVHTIFHLPWQDYTIIFLNIYFDLCEIERRKMDAVLHQQNYSLAAIDSIYKASVKAMDQLTWKYLNEVNLGKNSDALKKWNQLVFDQLKIDNIELLTDKSKGK